MTKLSTRRELKAVLAADMVGYSRLVQNDEEGTIARYRAHFDELIKPKIEDHHGRIVKTTGDGILAEFASAVDAVNCAAQIQRAIEDRERATAEHRRISYRIGINVGDIVIDGADILGDGVNIAARLEALAPPGGICISRNVFDQVQNKVELGFEDIGPQQVKNIATPVPAYTVLLDRDEAGVLVKRGQKSNLSRRRIVVTACALLALLACGIAWWQIWAPAWEPVSPGKRTLPATEGPSIAVLPFSNISGDKAQDYFADGMAEDIITDLSKVSALQVVPRQSSFRFRGSNLPVTALGSELGVRYLLEGSVRRSGTQVRINAKLIDAQSGVQIWADRYDGLVENTFELQDKVTARIIEALEIQLGAADSAKLRDHGTNNFAAHDAFLKGQYYARQFTDSGFKKAIAEFQRALKLDPNYERAAQAIQDVQFMRDNSGLQ